MQARKSYDGLREQLRGIRERTLNEPMMDPTRNPPLGNCYAKPPAEQADCVKEDEAVRKRFNENHDHLEHEVLPALLADSPVLSMSVRRSKDNDYAWAWVGPQHPKQKLGTRNVDVGIELGDGTKLGWGEYRTSHFSPPFPMPKEPARELRGDDKLHSGIEVVYRTSDSYVKMVVLTDGFRRPKEWR